MRKLALIALAMVVASPVAKAAERNVPLLIEEIQGEDHILNGRIRAALVAQLNKIGRFDMVAEERTAEYAVKLVVLRIRANDGSNLVWVVNVVLTGATKCDHATGARVVQKDGRTVTYITAGMFYSGGEKAEDIEVLMASIAGDIDQWALPYSQK